MDRGIAEFIAKIPDNVKHTIIGAKGEPYTNSAKLGQLVSEWLDQLGLCMELRLYDAHAGLMSGL